VSGELDGRTALITGATQGLGLEIARHFLRAGVAGICICGRDPVALQAAGEELRMIADDRQEVLVELADVSDPEQVSGLVERALERFPELTVLVNNAGIYGPKGTLEQVDWADWTKTIEINLLGSVFAARALFAHFRSRGYGKIIQLSGGGATSPMPRLSAYAASKAAVVRFAETLAEELREFHIDVNAVAPGASNTRMLDEVLQAGPERVGQAYYERALEQQRSGGTPLERGAELAVWLASAASDGITAKLLSALWDPWSDLALHRDELASDIYTLRRIVPRDRGLDWGDK
jgi:NAD(P)-dependent dehydrogenase (short-subunit alcohol dehydrogenase family)